MEKPHLLTQSLKKRPKAIMLSFGDVSPFVEEIKAASIPLICQVQSVSQAIDCIEKGADIIVAQGTEAGGHGACYGSISLIPSIVDAVPSVPVIAAGGICDARGIEAACDLGAVGVLMGTRFFASNEALASDSAKAQLIRTSGEDTIRTNVFDYARGYIWPQPYTARALKNKFTQRWHGQACLQEKISAAIRQSYQEDTIKNNFEEAAIFAGEGVGLIHEIHSAKKIVAQLSKNIRFTKGK